MSAQEDDVDSEGQGGQEEQPMVTQSSSTMMTPQPGMMAPVRPPVQCRSNAKIVAYINIIVNFLHLMFLAGMIILLAYHLPDLEGHVRAYLELPEGQEIPEEYKKYIEYFRIGLIACIIVLLILAVLVLIELFIAWGLLKSTRVGTPPGQAIQKAKCWLCCHICLVILNILCMGSFLIMPSARLEAVIPNSTFPSSSTSSSYESMDSNTHPSLQLVSQLSGKVDQIKRYGRQADQYTIGFGGFNIILFFIRLLFMFIVHSFMRQLRSVGFSMM